MTRPILTNTVCQIDNGGQLKLVFVTSDPNPFFAASFSSSGGLFPTEPNRVWVPRLRNLLGPMTSRIPPRVEPLLFTCRRTFTDLTSPTPTILHHHDGISTPNPLDIPLALAVLFLYNNRCVSFVHHHRERLTSRPSMDFLASNLHFILRAPPVLATKVTIPAFPICS